VDLFISTEKIMVLNTDLKVSQVVLITDLRVGPVMLNIGVA
jgi:hypothetical protein